MNIIKGHLIYTREINRLKEKQPAKLDLPRLYIEFPQWFLSLSRNNDPLANEIPWITYSAINYLENFLNKKTIVFEYGSGGSTLYVSKRVKEGISVEHDEIWVEKVKQKLPGKRPSGKNCSGTDSKLDETKRLH